MPVLDTTRLAPRPGDIELGAEALLRTPLFADPSAKVGRRLEGRLGQGAVVVRRYAAGEPIVTQGEAGWTAFYLLGPDDAAALELPALDGLDEDLAEVRFVPGADTAAAPDPGPLQRLLGRIWRRRPRYPTVEAGVALSPDAEGRLLGRMRAGELMGEISCFHAAPRSATVRALRDCYAIEMVRNVLELALENDEFRAALDRTYRQRVLKTALTLIPLFADAPPAAIEALLGEVELVGFDAGASVFEAGSPADALWFVRQGTLELHEPERLHAYAARGETLGQAAVLAGGAHALTARVRAPAEGAGKRAGGGAELIRVPAALVHRLVAAHPAVAAAARRPAPEAPPQPPGLSTLAGALGLIQAEKVKLIDLDACTRCGDCETACASTHGGVSHLRREGPRFGTFLVPASCRQCLDPLCMVGCPVGSIHRGRTGEIVVEDWCIGCGLCADQCPHDAIAMLPEGGKRKAATCDQCASMGEGPPLCVQACGPGAAKLVDGRSYFTGREEGR